MIGPLGYGTMVITIKTRDTRGELTHVGCSMGTISLHETLALASLTLVPQASKDTLSIVPSQEFIRDAVLVTWLPANGVEETPRRSSRNSEQT